MDGTPIVRKSTNVTSTQEKTDMQEDHDFGFSFTTEEEMTVVQENNEKAEKLRDMIMPLLMNLKKNPDKDIIKWEGDARIKSIDAFIKKMNKLVDG
jgi:hypothetical protein